ncbi:hypothetical protein PHYSODRAFT_323329 [Phytophthora sojae]|uniref:HTH CENPB-type domain-containing protein n=1 Tax=Phytophthora sojae (strain P6497) TaxID=1094619 RepID=G4YQA5_PHYSP|nr:hypothetical protein PHYSODRAFT_323329 [Phytophthora sojae]EGZ29871.1 hypothetical protein PHYSODRAFT_323329 [Phytophthora sojae]|eukprot:XP_009517146.1 hypothetical protein PHYSODRAFT_323329 [Phytophthora sojae]
MGGQGRGRRLTDRERLEIAEFARLHPQVKHVELAAAYRVNESTIRKWRRKSNVTKTERARQFDVQLYEWICAARSRGVKLRPIQVRDKARALAANFEHMENFKASSGWYYRYCGRFNLTLNASVATVQDGDRANSTSRNGAGSGGERLEKSCQAAIAQFLHHHAALLTRASRMRFIKHLADGPEELKAFTRMTTDARVQYAKSFAGDSKTLADIGARQLCSQTLG